MPAPSTRPRISIGMPLYNREKYVGAAIECHLNQSFGDFELIITDNASTDRSEEICRDYASKDPRVKFFKNPVNLGATGNFRRAFELATGEFFRWHPSDDLVSANMLERAVDILDHDQSVFVAYAPTKLIDGDGNPIGEFQEGLHAMHNRVSDRWKSIREHLRLGNLHYGLSRTALMRQTGLLRNYSGGDFPLILEMCLYGKFFEIADAAFYRRMHEAASSALKANADVMAFFDPAKKNQKLFLYYWVHLGANLKSVGQAPIPASEKLRILAYEGRRLFRGRRAYAQELAGSIAYAARKLTKS